MTKVQEENWGYDTYIHTYIHIYIYIHYLENGDSFMGLHIFEN